MPFNISVAEGLTMPGTPSAAPTVKGVTRLEGRPRTADFERSLRAEVRDALWFLTRQWQFGEFKGEDAGSPVEVRTAVRCTPLQHYASGGRPATPYDRSTPLEVRVEQETVPTDLLTHVQITEAFLSRVRRAAPSHLTAVRSLYRQAYPMDERTPAGALDGRVAEALALAGHHLFDGVRFRDEIEDGRHTARVDGFALPANVKAVLKQAAGDALNWFAALYAQPPAAAKSAWAPAQLEYQFACAAEAEGVPQTAVADQYASGHLDWYALTSMRAPARHSLKITPAPRRCRESR